jgi:hypothetical protein
MPPKKKRGTGGQRTPNAGFDREQLAAGGEGITLRHGQLSAQASLMATAL